MDVTGFTAYSVAMTNDLEDKSIRHLLRADGQEDLCLAVYRLSSGHSRFSALLLDIVLPEPGERHVHGVVTFSGKYVLRAARLAAEQGAGIAVLHSHPRGSGWQRMSAPDYEAEASYAALARELTGLPLVGMTLAGTGITWSARVWTHRQNCTEAYRDATNVRVIGDDFKISWNDNLRPIPSWSPMLVRTTSCWGAAKQAHIARLKVLIVGAGTLGHEVLVRLAATGIIDLGVMDFDTLEIENLDRLLTATRLDVFVHRSKLELADRECGRAATAAEFSLAMYELSICEPEAVQIALDYDLIFCCLDDRPWARSILNTIAYADLIPVIDGGVSVEVFEDGEGLRNATWRSHVLRPGRPCMACNGQLNLGSVHVDKAGLYDDADYIAGLPKSDRPTNQNVSVIAAGAVGGLLSQFVSFLAVPAGIGEPGPIRFSYAGHWLERRDDQSRASCPIELAAISGDSRQVLTEADDRARVAIKSREYARSRGRVKLVLMLERVLTWLQKCVVRLITAASEDSKAPKPVAERKKPSPQQPADQAGQV